jgi:hypothetical protein
MDVLDLEKLLIFAALYLLVAPLLALVLFQWRGLQKVAVAAMCMMIVSGWWKPEEWGLTIGFVENYRGHARGFHFFFNETLAVALILSSVFDPRRKTRWFPPGLWLYLAYCAVSLLSIINAPEPQYSWMAALKAFKVVLIFLAIYNFIRWESDVRFILTVFAITMLWQTFVVLKFKYINHVHQVTGTFEHQNALSMFATMIGMVFLAAGSANVPGANLYLCAYLGCAVIVECALSRAGMVCFGIGTAAVLLWSLIERVTARRIFVVVSIAAVSAIGLSMTLDSILDRFNDPATRDSNITRVMLKKASLMMAKDHPLGIGWNNYGITINHPYPYGDHIDAYFRSHGETIDKRAAKGIEESLYWLLLAETGFQGYIGFILFLAYFIIRNLQAAWAFRHRFLGIVSIGIAVGCGMNYMQSTVERVLTQPRNLMLWMVLLAIASRLEAARGGKLVARVLTPATVEPAKQLEEEETAEVVPSA